MTSINCYGDIMYEQHIQLDEYDNSKDCLVESVKFKVGGSAFNTANGLAKIGHKVNLISSIGTDIEGEYVKEILKNIKNINTDYVDFSNIQTSKVFALINNSKEHKFLSFRCNNIYMKKNLETLKIKKNDFLLISGYSLQDSNSKIICNDLIEKCRNNSGILSIDPSLHYANNFNSIERDYCIDYFFPNQEEASIISGVVNYEESAKILHEKNIKNIIITLGNNGCYFSNSFHSKLYKPQSICDQILTIGAGDNFVAGFISAKINQYSVEECVKSANKSAYDYLTNSNNK